MKSFFSFLSGFFQVLYFFVFLLTIAGFFAPYFSVKDFPPLQLFALFFLAFLPFHLIAFFIFSEKKKILRSLALLAFLMSGWVGLKEINYAEWEQDKKNELRVLSYNVENFGYNQYKQNQILAFIKQKHPDVVCFQEFCAWNRIRPGKDTQIFAEKIAKELGLPHFVFPSGSTHITNIAIFSKYPITKIDTLFLHKTVPNSGLITTIDSPWGLVGIGNLHLTSFNVNQLKKEYAFYDRFFPALYKRWVEVLTEQEEKVSIVKYAIESYPNPLILVGDFNAPPHSRVVTQISDRMSDGFREKGVGKGWTYPFHVTGVKLGIRIDYQFHNEKVHTLDYRTYPLKYADHYPVLGIYRMLR
ncbi:MAG: endonuclease/exonuclease/phosphatase family protein [Bacteroidia bacterium]